MGNRIRTVQKNNYDNWNLTPSKPDVLVFSDSGAIRLSININPVQDIDISHFEIYKNGNMICTSVSSIYVDNNVVLNIPYYYQVKSVDFYGSKSELSDVDSGLPGKEITLNFILDLRRAMISGTITEPQYGIGILGNLKPLTLNKLDNKMNKVKKGVYLFSGKFVTNNNLKFSYVLNPGTQIEKTEQSKIIFNYTSYTAKSVAVSGDFNGWNITANSMKNIGLGKWYLELNLPDGSYKYKFVIDGQYEPGSD
ncbi:glycogen-binding domain-containing protein, partial [Candidatus Dependentiae bacterium]|nr:glycogen-binding domain-containing protein [Candidatus Dependentiae bacterium]